MMVEPLTLQHSVKFVRVMLVGELLKFGRLVALLIILVQLSEKNERVDERDGIH